MAKVSKIVANKKKAKLAKKYRAKREELRNITKDESRSAEERTMAQFQLQRLPRNSSSIRVRNRCEMTGRPRAFLRDFRLSRIAFRELALRGMIPGVTKSSW